jgi:hypothetical protein
MIKNESAAGDSGMWCRVMCGMILLSVLSSVPFLLKDRVVVWL